MIAALSQSTVKPNVLLEQKDWQPHWKAMKSERTLNFCLEVISKICSTHAKMLANQFQWLSGRDPLRSNKAM